MTNVAKIDNRAVVADAAPVSADVLEKVLGQGDLSKLTSAQRVEYYNAVCRSMDLNPLTRPFEFLKLNGKDVMYATRACTDQLREKRSISLEVLDKQLDAGLMIVTVRARTPNGRQDEDVGAVVIPQSGEARANAILKAVTKAKRRVTLSICGLGWLDESELDTMQHMIDHKQEAPVARVAHSPAPELDDALPAPRTQGAFLAALEAELAAAETQEAVEEIRDRPDVQRAFVAFVNGNLDKLHTAFSRAFARVAVVSEP